MKYGIIVDGYSSGAELPREFERLGVNCIHIQSTDQIPAVYQKTFNSNLYIKNIIFQNNLDQLLQILNTYNPIFVIAGSEPGVEVADLLANNLKLANANPLETSICRRDKFAMYESIKNNNLAYIKQFKSSSLDELINWVNINTRYPVVIKPLKSAGGDRVKICYSESDIIDGYNSIINDNLNMLQLKDEAVLIQEYIEAEEIGINTVQYNGKSYLCEIVQFNKILLHSGKKIYDYATLIPFKNCDYKILNYAFAVANALDIKFGAMHAEIFNRPNSPVLIEAAARIMGANTPIELMKKCLTHPQLEMTALAFANPESFLARIQEEPRIKQNFRIIFLISQVSGKLERINYLEKIKSLNSFYDMKLRITDKIYKTEDYDTSPGLIYLCHQDESILENDYSIIRDFEANDMYEISNKFKI